MWIFTIIMELVTGEGGFIVAPKEYVKGLSKICKDNGILLIIDEIQTGFGRTGKMFASEHYNLKPDLVTTAKSLSNGMPLSAVSGRKELMDSVQPGGLGGTFSGNPLACEASLAAMEFIQKNNLPAKAVEIGKVIQKRFNEMKETYEFVGDARGLGAMNAIEIVKNKKSKLPDKERTDAILKKCHSNGLIILSTGVLSNGIRTLPPLTTPLEQIKDGLNVLEEAMKK